MCRNSSRLAVLTAVALLSWEGAVRSPAYGDDPPKGDRPRETYFPKVMLLTQDGKEVSFSDLIKDKIVVINFMYTRCDGKLCVEGTKNLVKLQDALGDKLGKDVFLYSITLDPEHDTPEVLKEYAKNNKAKWTFLTPKTEDNAQKIEDVTSLRRKLGLFNSDAKADADRTKHSGMIVIGNGSLDKWVKKSITTTLPDDIEQQFKRATPLKSTDK